MIEVGDLVRVYPMNRRAYDSEANLAGVWLVIRVDELTFSCHAIQGNKKEWFDLRHVWAVQYD
jgi:hypothetical protein